MPTRAQLESALFNADKAGDTGAAKTLANALKAQSVQEKGVAGRLQDAFTGDSQATQKIRSLPEIGEAPELNKLSVPAFKASMGLLSTGDNLSLQGILSSQLGDSVSFDEDDKGNVIVSLPSGEYALNQPGLSGQDVVRGAFNLLAFTPAGRASSVSGAAARSGLTEGVIEGAEQQLGGDDVSPLGVAGAAALGGFFKGAEDLLGAGYRAVKGRASSSLVDDAADAGIPVLTSDALPPQTFASRMAQQTGEKIPVAGTGGLREKQQLLRESAVADIAERYGQFSYDAIINSLKTQKNRVKKAAGNVLERVGSQLDDAGVIETQNTTNAIADAVGELNKKGVIKSQGALDDLSVLTQSLDEIPQTFTTLKENRTVFRDIIKGADKAERSQLNSRARTLLENVERAMKRDMSAHAKEHLSPSEFSKWNRANSVYAEEAKKLTKSRLKTVLDKGDITPESVQTLLFSQKPSEVKGLYQSLTSEGRQNARSAVISRVVTDLGKRQAEFTPNAFASEMKKYGIQAGIFFKGQEKRQLEGLLRVLNATRRAQDAAITTPTGQTVLGAGTGYAAFTDLTGTLGSLGTLGGLARLYESAPVRNALLRLASVPKGSTRFENALQDALGAMNAATQTLRRETENTE